MGVEELYEARVEIDGLIIHMKWAVVLFSGALVRIVLRQLVGCT